MSTAPRPPSAPARSTAGSPARAARRAARANGPDPASPWVLDTRSLGRSPGTMKQVRLRPETEARIGLDVIVVPAGTAIELDLRMEPVTEGVLISGTAAAGADGECSRCLTPLSWPLQVELRELYAYPGSTTAATTSGDEVPRLIDELIDLFPLVRDEIVLALPPAPICRDDCRGLCVDCGVRLDDLEPGHTHETLDARWAALYGRFGSGSSPS